MATEGFFSRWSRLKTEPSPEAPVAGEASAQGVAARPAGRAQFAEQGQAVAPPGARHGGCAPAAGPTLEDVAQLGADSDYSIFVARGVDKSVQRSAMKKLFSDPHFNVGDGLDLYMGDYNKPDPIPAAMMGALRHTESFFAQACPERQAEKERKAREESGIARASAGGNSAPGVAAGASGGQEGGPGAAADGADGAGRADQRQPALAVPPGTEDNDSSQAACRADAYNGGAGTRPVAMGLPPQPGPERQMADTPGAHGASESRA